ncbi:MAG TPA: hypothetical protein VJX92_12690 [Methylomirabilota bacterium]|nr:hypothetical protein [Methylomirabilota bacterium]
MTTRLALAILCVYGYILLLIVDSVLSSFFRWRERRASAPVEEQLAHARRCSE